MSMSKLKLAVITHNRGQVIDMAVSKFSLKTYENYTLINA